MRDRGGPEQLQWDSLEHVQGCSEDPELVQSARLGLTVAAVLPSAALGVHGAPDEEVLPFERRGLDGRGLRFLAAFAAPRRRTLNVARPSLCRACAQPRMKSVSVASWRFRRNDPNGLAGAFCLELFLLAGDGGSS